MVSFFRMLSVLVGLLFVFLGNAQAQRPLWRTFEVGDTINRIADDNDYIWVGTRNTGLIKLRKTTGQRAIFGKTFGLRSLYINDLQLDDGGIVWAATQRGLAIIGGFETEAFDTANSPIQHNDIRALELTPTSVWLGTWGGLASYDGESWQTWDSANSDLPDPRIRCLALDDTILWIGTQDGGLARLQGSTWTIYNTDNSDIASNSVWSVAVQPNGTVWAGTSKGLQHFDGTSWVDHMPQNSDIASLWVNDIVFDPKTQDVWAATHEGLSHLDGNSWENFDQTNSDLPGRTAESVLVDDPGDTWIALFDGSLAVYNEAGVRSLAPARIKHKIFPNPANEDAVLEIENVTPYEGTFSIYFWDTMGRLVGRQENFSELRIELSALNLPAGMLIYQIITEEGEVDRSKLMVIKAGS